MQSTPSSPDDINSSLLKQSSEKENHYILSRAFKSLKPLSNAIKIPSNSPNVALVHPVTKSSNGGVDLHLVPTRVAPPPPMVKNGDVQSKVEKFNLTSPPALPPMNKNSTARPLISNPILEASTSTAKEVPSIVKYPTLRPAPAAPTKSVVFNDVVTPEVLINPTSDKKPKDGTLSRIQSFLKKDSTPKVEKVHKQLKVIDKEKLKGLEISSPILIGSHDNLQTIDKKDEVDKRAKIKRAQSMRDPPSPPVAKPTFNPNSSMRQPRPKSIVERPSAPPPRPPAPAIARQASIENFSSFDSFESRGETPETSTPDNIYSVIDEKDTPQISHSQPPPGPQNQKGSIESVGLLGEIVNEIEHRNFDSIYIASTLKKKKKEEPKYENTNEEIYNGEAESVTSSGYMRPINNTPVARIPPSLSSNKMPSSTSSTSMSSFKSARSGSSDGAKSPLEKTLKFDGPMKKSNSETARKIAAENTYKTPTSNKPLIEDKKSLMKKATTTPSISSAKKSTSVRNRSPSPSKATTSTATKPKLSQKPSISDQKNLNKNPTSKVLNVAASKKSTVAALQQKFESSNS